MTMIPTLISDAITTPMVLEAIMLTCFGLAWPMANFRMLRTRRAEGKGLGFTLVILCGYLAGASAKLVLASDGASLAPVFWLYLFNGCSVGTNLALQWHYGGSALMRTLSAPAGTLPAAVLR
jgi:hypothetical protein